MDLPERCKREVVDLHVFFDGWFAGRTADTPEAFERVERALADDFGRVTPDGELEGKVETLEHIREAHGSRSESFDIDTRNVTVRFELEEGCLVTYEELQHGEDEETIRFSTALLTRDEEAPNGVAWRHLQETWLSEE